MPYTATKSILLIAGLIGAVVGSAILISPVAFHGTTGIELGSNPSLMSEVRAPGGGLLAIGLLIMAGAFVSRLTFTALVVAALVYVSYGASRIFSMAVDGMPHSTLVIVAGLEIVIGVLCIRALVGYRGLADQPAV